MAMTVVVSDPMDIAVPAPLPPVEEVPESPPAAVVTNLVNAWVSLANWGLENGYGRPVQVGGVRNPAYELRGTNRVAAFRVGSRAAFFNGYEYWLGYAPQLINGLPHIHLLDVLKNLRPLLGLTPAHPPSERAVVIDPGHGGKDAGARSVFNGVWEKEYALDWSLRLARLLIASGWTVYLTRTNDTAVSLADRVGLAEQARASLFLSLHFNSGLPNRDLAGIETYCLTPSGMPSSLVRSYEDDPRQVYPNNAFDDRNFQFAFGLHRTLLQHAGAVDRGVRRARFMSVLRSQNRPAVLIEGGYLTNPQEARRIASPAYRQTLAEAVAKGLE
jgi:N-acetylmuramoyl-L-alanine amidase